MMTHYNWPSKKAKESLLFLLNLPMLSDKTLVTNTGPAVKCLTNRPVDCSVLCQLDGDDYQESLGLHIFNEVVQVHPDIHLAAKLTGMILDMDSVSLHSVVADQQLIQLAIDKAYRALHSAS
ncbi:hypothetical protein Btru_035070 [Bulinus truncatus]|nr:hypothetical protein Btru_035070 [Bulinus truncatus]